MMPLLIVLTLNIWGLPDLGFRVLSPLREERVQAICETLRQTSQQPNGWDVILLQEVWVAKDRATLKNCGYPYSVDSNRSSAPLDSGLLFLSKHPIEESSRLTYPALPADKSALETGEALAQKSAQMIRIKHPQLGFIWIGNTHLVSQYSETNDTFQTNRLEQFETFVRWAEKKSNGEPLILGGDWNFGPGMPMWNSALPLMEDFTSAPGSEKLCTICPPNSMHTKNEGKVDHLLGSKHFQAVEGKLSFVTPIALDDIEISPSDHFGWSTSFRLLNPK